MPVVCVWFVYQLNRHQPRCCSCWYSSSDERLVVFSFSLGYFEHWWFDVLWFFHFGMVTTRSRTNRLAGDMFSWGHGGHGRLGHGVCDAAMRPTKILLSKVEGGAQFKFVAVGEAHSASIDSLGQVWCWGAGSFGRCGHGEETDFLVPQVVTGMIGKSCSQLALGVCHSLALTRPGRIWSWGGFLYTGHGEDDDIEAARELDDEELKGHSIVEIAAGRFHSLALASTGEVFSWGAGSLGRLGLGSSIEDDLKTRDQPTPMQIFVNGNALLGWQKKTSKLTLEKRGRVAGEHAELQVIACVCIQQLWGKMVPVGCGVMVSMAKTHRVNWKTSGSRICYVLWIRFLG